MFIEDLTSGDQGVQPLDGDAKISLVGNGVASIDGFGLVPGQLHRDGAGHACAFEIADGGAAQVVRDAARTARLAAGSLPDFTRHPVM